ncbi:MAG: glycosyltransferase family 2 protein, partial [Defluviitaleaceae bacterium]|nr:glycosyltransferase family 2 protein [Defluviitaleaceae bacterium]
MNPTYTVVIPVYNEQESIPECHRRVSAVMKGVGEPYEILFINDGSKDRSPELLREICAKDKNVKCVSFSRNFGHMPAITAGLDFARGDAVLVIDADLQDPPE